MSDPKPLILIVEDEEDMLLGLQHNLEFEGYRTIAATTGREGLERALTGIADLVVLDVMLPELNGFEVLREMRERKVRTPVILLTSKSLENDKLEGFSLGADDYVTKPFSIQELEQHVVRRNQEPLTLALKEFEILHLLVRYRGEIVTREQMLQEVWGYAPGNFPETRTVDNHIAKLRNKVGAQFIETIPKLGYRLRA
jgi:DNA-binding response OmpR family regulator